MGWGRGRGRGDRFAVEMGPGGGAVRLGRGVSPAINHAVTVGIVEHMAADLAGLDEAEVGLGVSLVAAEADARAAAGAGDHVADLAGVGAADGGRDLLFFGLDHVVAGRQVVEQVVADGVAEGHGDDGFAGVYLSLIHISEPTRPY